MFPKASKISLIPAQGLSLSPTFNSLQNNSLSISDCFRIVEKSRFSSSSHLKLVYELKLTKEAALRGFPGNRAWFLLLSDLISSSFEQLPVKKAVNLTISIGRTAVTMECPWTDDMDIYQLGVLLWTLAVEGNKKVRTFGRFGVGGEQNNSFTFYYSVLYDQLFLSSQLIMPI